MYSAITSLVALTFSALLLSAPAALMPDTPAPSEQEVQEARWAGYGEEQRAFLRTLSALDHYDETREERYLAYLGSPEWTPERPGSLKR